MSLIGKNSIFWCFFRYNLSSNLPIFWSFDFFKLFFSVFDVQCSWFNPEKSNNYPKQSFFYPAVMEYQTPLTSKNFQNFVSVFRAQLLRVYQSYRLLVSIVGKPIKYKYYRYVAGTLYLSSKKIYSPQSSVKLKFDDFHVFSLFGELVCHVWWKFSLTLFTKVLDNHNTYVFGYGC
mgnify:CR=1 FL=1